MPLSEVNYLAVLTATVAAWFFGALWYTALSKRWVAALGKTMEQLKAEGETRSRFANIFPFILSFIAEFIMAIMLYGIMTHSGLFGLRAGMISGVLIWAGFVITTHGGQQCLSDAQGHADRDRRRTLARRAADHGRDHRRVRAVGRPKCDARPLVGGCRPRP